MVGLAWRRVMWSSTIPYMVVIQWINISNTVAHLIKEVVGVGVGGRRHSYYSFQWKWCLISRILLTKRCVYNIRNLVQCPDNLLTKCVTCLGFMEFLLFLLILIFIFCSVCCSCWVGGLIRFTSLKYDNRRPKTACSDIKIWYMTFNWESGILWFGIEISSLISGNILK